MNKILPIIMYWLPCVYVLMFSAVTLHGQQITPYKQQILLKDSSNTYNAGNIFGVTIKKNTQHGITTHSPQGQNVYFYYTPDPGYVGTDTLIYEYWKTNPQNQIILQFATVVYHVKPMLLRDDFVNLNSSDSNVFVDYAQNDIYRADPLQLHVSYAHNVDYVISNNLDLQVTPLQPGNGFIRYVVCDEDGYCSNATISFSISGNSNAIADTFYRSTLKETSLELHLGSFSSSNVIQTPFNGQALISNDFVVYTPGNNFFGVDTLGVELIHTNNETTQIIYIIQVINFNPPNTMLVDDHFYTTTNEPVNFNVRNNDIIKQYALTIPNQPTNGVLTVFSQGNMTYTPNSGFKGVDVFTYRVCTPGTPYCETAVVKVEVSNKPPELNTFRFTTAINTPYVIRYLIPLSNFEYNQVLAPEYGTLEIYEGDQTIDIDGQPVAGFNMIVYTPGFGFVGEDEMRIQYCAGGECKDLKIYVEVQDYFPDFLCYDDCIWPGDINNDGRVDMQDLLPLAYHLGEVGYSRNTSTEHWTGETGMNWGNNQLMTGYDLKYTDADGNGMIAAADTTLISQHYLKYHRLIPPAPKGLSGVPFILEPTVSSAEEGDTVTFNIIIGTSNFPALEYTGLSFQLDFLGTDFLDTSSIQFQFADQSWLTNGGPTLQLSLKPHGARLDAGIARADGKHTSGYGLVGKMDAIIIRDLTGFHIGKDYLDIPVRMSNGLLMRLDGSVDRLQDAQASVRVYLENNETERKNQLIAYPNPARSELTLALNGNAQIQVVEIYSISGQLAGMFSNAGLERMTIPISQLSDGFYIIKATSTEGVHTAKVQVHK